MSRVTLSDRKERRFRPAWEGRREVRRRLSRSRVVPWYVRRLAPLLVLPHAYFAIVELWIARQRVKK